MFFIQIWKIAYLRDLGPENTNNFDNRYWAKSHTHHTMCENWKIQNKETGHESISAWYVTTVKNSTAPPSDQVFDFHNPFNVSVTF